jgi:hypothetical protein
MDRPLIKKNKFNKYLHSINYSKTIVKVMFLCALCGNPIVKSKARV